MNPTDTALHLATVHAHSSCSDQTMPPGYFAGVGITFLVAVLCSLWSRRKDPYFDPVIAAGWTFFAPLLWPIVVPLVLLFLLYRQKPKREEPMKLRSSASVYDPVYREPKEKLEDEST